MGITRTAITDDDGSGTTGTVINNSWKQELYDQIDAYSPTGAIQTTTSTGTQNDFSLTAGVTLLRANNASALTFTGLSAGTDNQLVKVVAIGAGTVTFNNQDTGSLAANRIITSNGTALVIQATKDSVLLVYDGTTQRWRVIAQFS